MSESTLSLGYSDFRKEVGHFLGFGRDYTVWDSAQVALVDDIIQAGLRQFYLPPLLEGMVEVHEWSFLKQAGTITTIASYTTGTVSSSSTTVTLTTGTWPSWAATHGTLIVDNTEYTIASRTNDSIIVLDSAPSTPFSSDTFELEHDGNYDLPDDWNGWACKNLTFQPQESYEPVKFVSEGEIRRLRQFNDARQAPTRAAIRAKSSTGASGQRFELMLYPIPDAEYLLDGLYNVLLNKIDSSTYPYPLGGMAHAKTIEESCLAVAEIKVNDEAGLHKGLFQEALAISITNDRQREPDSYGYNGDNSTDRESCNGSCRPRHSVTYEGVLPEG